MKNSIAKIWILTSILLLFIFSILFFGTKTYQKISDSLDALSLPDKKSELTHLIFGKVLQAEMHWNTFIITGDSLHYKASVDAENKTKLYMDSLYFNSRKNQWMVPKLDTLKQVIEEKSKINLVLTDLKRKQNSKYYSQEALLKIKNRVLDSSFIDKAVVNRQRLLVRKDTIEVTDIIQKPDSYRGLGGFFRKLFGVSRSTLDTITRLEEQTKMAIELSENQDIIREYFQDSTVLIVKDILEDVMVDEVYLQAKLKNTEMDLFSYNEQLLYRIDELLKQIFTINNQIQMVQKGETIYNLRSNFFYFLGLSLLGVFLGLLMLWMIVKDFKENQLLRNHLLEEKEKALRLAKAKEDFLSKMSHEMKTPLHSMQGLIHQLDTDLELKDKSVLRGLHANNQHLTELIQNLLQQAKINVEADPVKFESILLTDLVKELEDLFLVKKTESKLFFKIEIEEVFKHQFIQCDSLKLKQICINLISNAFKFTEKGAIVLSFQMEKQKHTNFLKINVKDTGIGIEKVFHQYIFEPFGQVEKKLTTDNSQGTGLGLSITKHLVEQLNGTITLVSELYRGSDFKVLIPIQLIPHPKRMEDYSDFHQLQHLFFPINLILIEDDVSNQKVFQSYVTPHVNHLHLFESPDDALELIQSNEKVDLIFTDLNLPSYNGIEFLKKLQSISQVPVIILSASILPNEIEKYIALGFENALGKPFSYHQILNLILKHCKKNETNIQKINAKTTLNNGLLQVDTMVFMLNSMQEKIHQVAFCFEMEDWEKVATNLHQLKSNFEQFGVTHLSENIQSAELFIELKRFDRAKEILIDLLIRLTETYNQLQNIT
ncbi:MAG: hybrid sensor histidine kinase/response regulator [Flavobacterium sp.]